ncbi:MAG: amidohydrolase family protein [Thermaerobacter sp.]|nr:amidohydrolase family protein [Thermaerobacter sp.]
MLIRGGLVMPGDGPGFWADVALRQDRIIDVAPAISIQRAREVIDATGCWVCPGFIDMHAHSALQPFRDPWLRPKIAQGFTTELIHPDGLAPAPVRPQRRAERQAYLRALEGPGPADWTWSRFAEFLRALAGTRPTTTLVPAVGHNAVRDYVMGSGNRRPTAEEVRAMRRQIRLAGDLGARALSLGLIYLPGVYAETDELVWLAEEAAQAGLLLMPHMRNESAGVVDAVQEMVAVAQSSGVSLHLSHLKVVGHAHLVGPMLDTIEAARRTIDITFDQYPYGAGSTLLSALLPPWALAGGPAQMMARLTHPESRRRITEDITLGLPGWENLLRSCGAENIVIAGMESPRPDDVGKTLGQVAQQRGVPPIDAMMDLLSENALNVTMVDHYASEEVVRTIFRHPLALVGTDGIFVGKPHPRLFGTAGRVLGRYALREGLVSAEEAIARLTDKAARRLGLHDRGRIGPGLRADIVVLDPASYGDCASYEEPQCVPGGVACVLVGGQVVWRGGEVTGKRPGGVWGQ